MRSRRAICTLTTPRRCARIRNAPGRSPSAFPPGGGAHLTTSAAPRCFWRRRPRITFTATCWSSTAAGWAADMLMRATTFFTRFVGPAALTAAGMIGAGAVATRLLAGAWFGFDLLWVAMLVIPMVIVTLDSASRIGVTSGGRGLIDMIRTDIGAWLAWAVFLPMALVNVVVNMSQMSAM